MVGVDFVFLEGDTSLRRLVDRVQAAFPGQGREWYLYHVLVRERGVYRCIRLSQLSAELESRRWTLSTPLTDFRLAACICVPLDQIQAIREQPLRYPFVVVEQGGRPVALYQGLTTRELVRTGPVGWWKLVGCRLSEVGHIPDWPRPLPEVVVCDKVISVDDGITLSELTEKIGSVDGSEELGLAIRVQRGDWRVCRASSLLERIAAERPDAGPGSRMGTFIDLWPNDTVSLERLQAPWGLVKALLNSAEIRQLLITHQGKPVAVLRRHVIVRGSKHHRAPGWPKSASHGPKVGDRTHGSAGLVSTWFADQDRQRIPHRHVLAANRLYTLGVSISKDSQRGNVLGPHPALDARLMDHVRGHGASLILRLDSEDLLPLDTEQEITLSAGDTGLERYFRVVTPVRTGLCSLRLSAFYENNLVQSYRVYVLVAPAEGARPEGAGDGWWSECEYTLSADLSNLQDLKSRRVCIWIGEGKQEVQRAGIRGVTGMDIGPPLTVNVRLIEEALKRYRELLIQSCVQETPGELEYLYRPDHTPRNLATFEQSIKELAELGQMLYERVFGQEEGHAIAERLHEIEQSQTEPLVVQIARLSLDTSFPWAVLYDRPLYYHPGRNRVCQGFGSKDQCRAACPHSDDPHVVCPYGFWGFRYIVEQPLCSPGSFTSVATRLEAADRPRVAMVYGAGLELARYHQRRLDSIIGSRAQCVVRKTTATLLRELEGAPTVVYLYCHGENTRYRQWLAVGEGDPFMASHLGDHLREAWAGKNGQRVSAPLVVLNGCHTGYYDPSTLLSFVHRLGALGAAGVVGTEIPIHEYLANTFGEFFLTRLLRGEPVGRVIHDFRLRLLRKRNVLGLAYVPYCYADLHIERGSR